MDRSKDKLFGFSLETLPPLFVEEVKKYNLGKDGYWEVYAPNIDIARQQMISFVKFISKEQMNPAELIIRQNKAAPKPNNVDWGRQIGSTDRTKRGIEDKEKRQKLAVL